MNEKNRYHFGKFFSDYTIIVLPVPENLAEDLKNNILKEGEHILLTVNRQ